MPTRAPFTDFRCTPGPAPAVLVPVTNPWGYTAQSWLGHAWMHRPDTTIVLTTLPTTPAVTTRTQTQTTHLLMAPDDFSTLVVRGRRGAWTALPIVLRPSSRWQVRQKSHDHELFRAPAGHDMPALVDIHTLESDTRSWAGLIDRMPDIRAPWADPDAPLEGIDPETRRPYAWPAALPYRGWSDDQGARIQEALHAIALLCLWAAPHLPALGVDMIAAIASQRPDPTPAQILTRAVDVQGRNVSALADSYRDLDALTRVLFDHHVPVCDPNRLTISPGEVPRTGGPQIKAGSAFGGDQEIHAIARRRDLEALSGHARVHLLDSFRPGLEQAAQAGHALATTLLGR